MATLFVDKLDPQSGTALEIGSSGDTITIPSGATLTNNGTATGFGGITVADQWRVTANITANADPISSNLEQIDTAGQGTLGSAMSVSSGVFTFPSTGIYLVEVTGAGVTVASGDNISLEIEVTTNNASYTSVAYSAGGDGGSRNQALKTSTLIDVTDTSNVKVRFKADSIASGSYFFGSSTRNDTFLRLLEWETRDGLFTKSINNF